MATPFDPSPATGKTLAFQSKLPKLPIPELEQTCERYLRALKPLQDEKEHEASKAAVKSFLEGDGKRIQERLKEWAASQNRSVFFLVCNLYTPL